MLKLLQSIFKQTPEASSKYDEELIEKAIERVVDGTDPRVRAISGYRKKLSPSVIKAVDYTVELVDGLPPPITLSRKQFSHDDSIRAIFVSPDHISEFLTQSHILQDYIKNRRGLDPEFIYALLSVKRVERKVLGMEINGELTRRDVAQVSVSFSNHRLSCPMDEAAASLFETKKDVFDFFIKQALMNIVIARDKQHKETAERSILSNKLRTLESAHWGIDAVLRGEGEKAVNVGRTESSITNMEDELKKVDTPQLTLDHYLDLIAETLNHCQDYLWKTAMIIKLDRMGIKIEKEATNAPVTLNIEEYHSSEDRSVIALPICIPFDQIPEGEDFLAKASRYL